MKVVKVTNMQNVDVTQYKEGDIFISEKEKGILHQGKIDFIITQKDLKGYVKKSEFQKMIDKTMSKGGKSE